MKRTLIVFVIAAAALAGAIAWWVAQPLAIPKDGVEIRVPPGASFSRVASDLEKKGVIPSAKIAVLAARWWGNAKNIQAGEYLIEPPHTLRSLIDALSSGKATEFKFTIVEGWNTRDLLTELAKAPDFKKLSEPLTRGLVAKELKISENDLEGRFFPDTYFYTSSHTPLSVLRRANEKMTRELDAAWAKRAPDLPYKDPRELLIMASIIEKETSAKADRSKVASVFVNRQRIGMRLQTDPTIIYGLGEKFDGNLTRAHLQTDGPYNSYTRAGLPPTPISLPGRDSLEAAIKPANTQYIYFVARGDGTSEFSETLDQHNRAVAKFQLKK